MLPCRTAAHTVGLAAGLHAVAGDTRNVAAGPPIQQVWHRQSKDPEGGRGGAHAPAARRPTLTLAARQAQGLDLRAALLRFYEQHYSASVMAAVVLGQESLDELQRMVEERFAGVVRRDVEPPVCPPEPWGPEQLRLRVSAVPVKELRSVQLYFQLPSMQVRRRRCHCHCCRC